MARFMIGNQEINFSEDYAEYGAVRKRLGEIAKLVEEDFTEKYKAYGDMEKVAENIGEDGLTLIGGAFITFKGMAMNHEVYDFSIEKLLQHPGYERVTAPFANAHDFIMGKLEEIDAHENSEKARRQYRKDTRSRIVGGGFGLGGAAKGMATAGAINIGTGILHSSFNMIGNAVTSLSAYNDRQNLYNGALPVLVDGLRNSIFSLVPVICSIMKVYAPINIQKEESIMKNIDEGNFNENAEQKAFADAFLAYPFDERLYVSYLIRYPEEQENITQMAEYFGVSMEDFLKFSLNYNGFHFKVLSEAMYIRELEQGISNIVDGIAGSKGLERYITAGTTLLEHSDKLFVGYMLQHYQNMVVYTDHPEVVEYRNLMYNHLLDIFNRNTSTYSSVGYSDTTVASRMNLKLGVYSLLMGTMEGYAGAVSFGKLQQELQANKELQKLLSDPSLEIYFSCKVGKEYFVLSNRGIVTHAIDTWIAPTSITKLTYNQGIMSPELLVDGKSIGTYSKTGALAERIAALVNTLLPDLKLVCGALPQGDPAAATEPEGMSGSMAAKGASLLDFKHMSGSIFAGLTFASCFLGWLLIQIGLESIAGLVTFAAWFYLAYKRLESAGKNKALVLLIIPFNILYMLYLCSVTPLSMKFEKK